MPVHVYGNICDIEAIDEIAKGIILKLYMMLLIHLVRDIREKELVHSVMHQCLVFMLLKYLIQ